MEAELRAGSACEIHCSGNKRLGWPEPQTWAAESSFIIDRPATEWLSLLDKFYTLLAGALQQSDSSCVCVLQDPHLMEHLWQFVKPPVKDRTETVVKWRGALVFLSQI